MKRMTVTPGFLLLVGVLFYLDEGIGFFWWAVLACCVHELGHYVAARWLGGHFDWLRLSVVGAEMSLSYGHPLSYPGEMAVVLAGPLTNLVVGAVAAWWGSYLAAAINFGLGAFNLMPILPLDGGKALWNGLSAIWDGQMADRVLTVTAGLLVGLLVGIGLVAASLFANGTLLLTALWLLWVALRGNRGKSMKKA